MRTHTIWDSVLCRNHVRPVAVRYGHNHMGDGYTYVMAGWTYVHYGANILHVTHMEYQSVKRWDVGIPPYGFHTKRLTLPLSISDF